MPKSRKLRPSSTPGKLKGANCQKSQKKNLFVNDTRLYKKDSKLWLSVLEEVQTIQKAKGSNNTLHELVN